MYLYAQVCLPIEAIRHTRVGGVCELPNMGARIRITVLKIAQHVL